MSSERFVTVSLGNSARSRVFLYFTSETEPLRDELKMFLSQSKALVLERPVSDGVDKLERKFNELLRGTLFPYVFADETKTLNEYDLVSLYLLIHKHPSISQVYLERSPFTRATDPWDKLAAARIDPKLGLSEQLRQLQDILHRQAELHKKRDAGLAQLLREVTAKHGNVTVVRGRAHSLCLKNACEHLGLNCEVYIAPLWGKQLLQEKLVTRMAGDEEPSQDELKAALEERKARGGVH